MTLTPTDPDPTPNPDPTPDPTPNVELQEVQAEIDSSEDEIVPSSSVVVPFGDYLQVASPQSLALTLTLP